ncbi:MAG: hypothetical protein ACLFTR_02600 [Candidatus Woesearchaeota archaeon]
MSVTYRKQDLYLIVIIMMSVMVLSSCDDFLTGNVAKDPDDTSFSGRYLECADGAGLHIDDMCIDDNVVKMALRNNRRKRIESLFITFPSDDDAQEDRSIERQLTMDIGTNKVLDQRFSGEDFNTIVLVPTYRSHDGALLRCDELEVAHDDIRRCS